MKRRSLQTHFVIFALIGALGTVAHYVVLVLLVVGGQFGPVFGTQVGAVVGALLNYGLNRRLNYRAEVGHRHTGPRFAAVALAGWGLNGAIVAVLTAHSGWHFMIAQVMATSVVLVLGFLANHHWTFSRKRTPC